MTTSEFTPPSFPSDVRTAYFDSALGTMRSRTVGEHQPGVPEVVLVQGMAVADYLMPGLGAFAAWTRAHLVELPGFAGSGEPPHELDVDEFGRCAAEWVAAHQLGDVILAGHSSGTQVAASAAAEANDVAGVVLASPTVDPASRGWLRLAVRWRWDSRNEPPGLDEIHLPEWKRAGPRRLLHTVRVHLRDSLEASTARLAVPVLVIRGEQDRISTRPWGRTLGSHYVEVAGAHTFPWLDPTSWSEPVRRFATSVAGRT